MRGRIGWMPLFGFVDPQPEGCYADVQRELERATTKFPPFASAHEGYAILLEEVDELWEEVKKSPSNRDPKALRKEAVQVAAMAIRFIRDVCDKETT